MRMVRRTAKALAGIALVPGLLVAQATETASTNNGFNDSWFWGVNGGMMTFTAGVGSDVTVTAPMIGGEWFITRSAIALRVTIQQAFFDEQGEMFDPTVAGNVRPVNVENWRRYAAEVYFIPTSLGTMRPYAGLGLSLNLLRDAVPAGSFATPEQMDEALDATDRLRSRVAATFTGGVQWQLWRGAVFVQASAMPTQRNFLFSRSHYTFIGEAGLRINMGTAIEKF
jgi:hypothetical protein